MEKVVGWLYACKARLWSSSDFGANAYFSPNNGQQNVKRVFFYGVFFLLVSALKSLVDRLSKIAPVEEEI